MILNCSYSSKKETRLYQNNTVCLWSYESSIDTWNVTWNCGSRRKSTDSCQNSFGSCHRGNFKEAWYVVF